jgi:hypothetical protein
MVFQARETAGSGIAVDAVPGSFARICVIPGLPRRPSYNPNMKPATMATSPLLAFAAILLLAGCVLSKPTIHTENLWGIKGWPVESFTSGEEPVVFVENVGDNTEVVVDVLSLSGRKTIRSIRMRTGGSGTNSGFSSGFDINAPHVSPFSTLSAPLRGLGAGNYTLALWIKGELVDTQDISLTGPSAAPGNSAPHLRVQPFAVRPGVGGGANTGLLLDRLDQLVTLTAAQATAAERIFTEQNTALRAFASIEDRMVKGTAIRQNARAKIRALLTSSQQQIYDAAPQRLGGGSMHDPANPDLAQHRETREFLAGLIKNSPAVAARLGPIGGVAPTGRSDSHTTFSYGQLLSMRGRDRFNVQGSARSEVLTVEWEKPSASAPITIARIYGENGDVIAP